MIDKAQQSNDIPVKEAIRIAKDYVSSLYADSEIHDLMLEEVRKSADESTWLITIGFSRHEPKRLDPSAIPDTSLVAALFRRDQLLERDYKIVEINRATGDVMAMKIRDISASVD